MKTQIFLDENGRTSFDHHSNHKTSYDKNVVLLSVITISVLIMLFSMFGVKGQTPNTTNKKHTTTKTKAKKTVIMDQPTKFVPPVNNEDSLIESYHSERNVRIAEIEKGPYTVVEQMPEYPGGEDSLRAFLRREFKYPKLAMENDVMGTVYVTFVVGSDGYIKDIKVLRGIGSGCDEEAVRIVKKMPSWKPGMQNGKAVAVQFNFPIRFRLD